MGKLFDEQAQITADFLEGEIDFDQFQARMLINMQEFNLFKKGRYQ